MRKMFIFPRRILSGRSDIAFSVPSEDMFLYSFSHISVWNRRLSPDTSHPTGHAQCRRIVSVANAMVQTLMWQTLCNTARAC